jgi:hypothetical protein
MKINLNKFFYLSSAAFVITLLVFYGDSGAIVSDKAVYRDFFSFLAALKDSVPYNLETCQSFEPFFCFFSYFLSYILKSDTLVHWAWGFIFYILTTLSFLILWHYLVGKRIYNLKSFCALCFVLIFFVDPMALFFLTRQYIASSFIMFMLVFALSGSHVIALMSKIAALGIHFFSIFLILVNFCKRTIRLSVKFFLISFLFLISIALCLNFYSEVLIYKYHLYKTINDGDVALLEEVKLFILLFMSRLAFKKYPDLSNYYGLLLLLYPLTLLNDLLHLRIHYYLIALSWPSVFMIIRFRGGWLLLLAGICYRCSTYLYRYTAVYS